MVDDTAPVSVFYQCDINAPCIFQCSIIPSTALAILFQHHGNMVEGSIKFVARPSSRSNSLSRPRGHPLFRSRSAECVCVVATVCTNQRNTAWAGRDT